MEVVQLRDRPAVSDMPAQLRMLADDIEAGRTVTKSIVVVLPGYNPAIFAWGDYEGDFWLAGSLDAARAIVIQKLIEHGGAVRT